MSSLLVYAPAMAHTLPNHPESHHRMERLMPLLEKEGVLAELAEIKATPATTEQLMRVHSLSLIEHIRKRNNFV